MNDSERMVRLSTSRLAWLLAYIATMALIVGLLVAARGWVRRELGGQAAQRAWQDWVDDEQARAADPQQPVRRRTPEAEAPPLLILMETAFTGVVVVVVLIATVLFGFFYLAMTSRR